MENKRQNERNEFFLKKMNDSRFYEDRWRKMEKKKGFFKKLLSITMMIGISVSFFAKDVVALLGDPRSHQFAGSMDPANTEDEGYRWRNSFDFTINGHQIVEWDFNDGTGFGANLGEANEIHQTLSRLLIPAGVGGAHMAAAAITIVIQNPLTQNLEAYSEVISDPLLAGGAAGAGPAVSIPAVAGGNPAAASCGALLVGGRSMYYTNVVIPPGGVATNLLNFANNVAPVGIGIGVNIPPVGVVGGGYSCCEGQIVTRLFDTNPPALKGPLLPVIIGNLLGQAILRHPGVNITNANIVLVVLHIHSRYDACAKCSKVLAGLSRLMNSAAAPGLAGIGAGFAALAAAGGANPLLLDNLAAGNARFLVEVSSNAIYGIAPAGCSRAEASGRDINIAAPINIPLGGPIAYGIVVPPATANNPLAIPNGLGAVGNFNFPNTFPPYVIFGRVNGVHQVTPIPPVHGVHPAGANKPPVI